MPKILLRIVLRKWFPSLTSIGLSCNTSLFFPHLSRYLLKIMGTGESVRLQYRSLQKILSSQAVDDRRLPQPNQENS